MSNGARPPPVTAEMPETEEEQEEEEMEATTNTAPGEKTFVQPIDEEGNVEDRELTEEEKESISEATGSPVSSIEQGTAPEREAREFNEQQEQEQQTSEQTGETLTRQEVLQEISSLQEQSEALANQDNFSQTDLRRQQRINQQIRRYRTALEENPRQVVGEVRDEETGAVIPVTQVEEFEEAAQRIREQTGFEPQVTQTEQGLQLQADIQRIQDRQNAQTFFNEQSTDTTSQSIADLAGIQDQGTSFGGQATVYRRNPEAVQQIDELQQRLSDTLLTEQQRENIQDRIDALQNQARQPAEYPGGTNIPGQSYLQPVNLPQRAQDVEYTTPPSARGPIQEFTSTLGEFQERPEAEEVDSIDIPDNLADQAVFGLSTLTRGEGFTYLASFTPGGTTPEEVAERSIERSIEQPQTGGERVAEIALESPAGLIATAGLGTAAGAGARTAQVIGRSGLAGQAARAAGIGAAGFYTGSQAAQVQRLASEGETTRAGGEILRTGAELGAFGKGYRAFQRFDSPSLGRTSVSQVETVLQQVDDDVYRGVGQTEARTVFERGPFSTRVLGLDQTGEISTNVRYTTVADEGTAEARGVLTQEIPDSENTLERGLEARSRVLETSNQGQQTVQEDIVRTRAEGRLFQSFNDFESTTLSRRLSREDVDTIQLQGDQLTAEGVQRSFPNPYQTGGGVTVTRPVDGQVSRFETTSLSRSGDEIQEDFGEARTLILRDSDGFDGGAGSTGTGTGGRVLTVEELGGATPTTGIPSEGIREQASRAAREAVSPSVGSREYVIGGAGLGVGRQAETVFQDGQRAAQTLGNDQVESFQADTEAQFERQSLEQQRFTREGGSLVEAGQVNLQTRGGTGLNQQFEASISGQLQVDRESFEGDNIASLRERPETGFERRPDTVSGPVTTPSRITRLRERRTTALGTGLDIGSRNVQDQRFGTGLVNIPFSGQRTGQGITGFTGTRLGLESTQRLDTRNVPRPVAGGGGQRLTGRPGVPGFEFSGVTVDGFETGEEVGGVAGGRIEPTFDIISAQRVEAGTGEQAVFDVSSEEDLLERQRQLGAFVRNKPVQTQNVSYEGSETGRRRFF